MQNSVDYGKAFTFAQEDPDWVKKLVIATLVQFIPLVGSFLLMGYAVEIGRRVIAGEEKLLPEWTDFGDLLKKGLFYFITTLIYVLPLALLVVCVAVPVTVMGAASDGSDAGSVMGTIGGVIGACFGCVAVLYGLAVGIIFPVVFGKVATTNEIGPALRVGDIVAVVRSNLGMFIIIAIVTAIATSILSSLGSILCGIGAFAGLAYANLVSAHIYGQAYRNVTSGNTGTVQTAM
jgi:hypothetical protein